MKVQDLLFLTIVIILLFLKRPKLLIFSGLTSLLLAIPLFTFWIFFSAQRLVWYAAAFFLIYVLFSLRELHKVQ